MVVACSQRVGAWQPLGGAVPRRPPPPQPSSCRAAGARARATRHEQKVTSPLPPSPFPPPHRTWPCALSSLPVCRLLDPANMLQFDDFKKCYGEILYRWGLRDKRADVLKFASCPPEPHRGIGASTSHLTPHTPPPGSRSPHTRWFEWKISRPVLEKIFSRQKNISFFLVSV